MSQQKIAHSYYLVLQSTYDLIEIGLGANNVLLDQLSLNKMDANRNLILEINNLLLKHNLILADLSFIATNLGPAPFTSLRVVIVTVNGLAFATGIPLIGVNGLQAFVTEFSANQLANSGQDTQSPTFYSSNNLDTNITNLANRVSSNLNISNLSPARPERNVVKSRDVADISSSYRTITLALLNAYNQDVYYGILDQSGNFTAGWGATNELLISLAARFKAAGVQKIKLIGNGVNLFLDKINQDLSNFELIINNLDISEVLSQSPELTSTSVATIPQYCSLKQVAQLAYQDWLTQPAFSAQLQPLYLKTVQTVVNKNYVKSSI